jgi:hypothetical protein
VVIKEAVAPQALTAAQRMEAGIKPEDTGKPVDLFTHIKWADGRVRWHQELAGVELTGTQSDVPADVSPWLVLRWNAVPGEHYGRGLAVEYIGDLISAEELSKSVIDMAGISARAIVLVNPAGVTDADDIKDAENGDTVVGREEDLSAFSFQKLNDFQVVKATLDDVMLRLSHAFLLRSGTVRDAERVTAEEIREMAQELEDVLGGVYTVLGQDLQLPLVNRLTHLMERGRELTALPKEAASPVIVTGFAALGRNHKVNRLRAALRDVKEMLGEQVAQQYLQADEVITRVFEGYGVEDTKDLVKDAATVAKETKNALADGAVAEAAPGVIQSAMQPQ